MHQLNKPLIYCVTVTNTLVRGVTKFLIIT